MARQRRTLITPRPQLASSSLVPSLQIVAGACAGKFFRLGLREMLIGRDEACDIVLPDPGVSGRHARFRAGPGQIVVVDLDSTNGTIIKDRSVQEHRLQEGDHLILGTAVARFGYMDSRALELASRIFEAATRDSLTGCFNRAHFMERLDQEVAHSNRRKLDMSLMMLDVDHFKRVNDQFGHPAGDQVLRKVGELLRSTIRLEDVLGRYGGEEFAVLLPHTDLESAVQTAERVRVAIEASEVGVTISLGVGCLADFPDAASLVQAADQALYRAKNGGRNRVERAAVTPSP